MKTSETGVWRWKKVLSLLEDEKFSVEFVLTLLLSTSSFSDDHKRCFHRLSDYSPDFKKIVAFAEVHKTLPLVQKNLLVLKEYIPEQIRHQCRVSLRQNSLRSMSQMSWLMHCMNLLEEAGVAVAWFKGPLFAENILGDVGLKQSLDIDALVRPEQIVKAVRALEKAGMAPLVALDNNQLRRMAQHDNELPMLHFGSSMVVDLQWELSGSFSRWRWGWRELEPDMKKVEMSGVSITTFGDTDMILYLCLHGAQHLWRELGHLVALREYLATVQDPDWNSFIKKVEQMGGYTIAGVPFVLLQRLYGIAIPDSVSKYCISAQAEVLAEQIIQVLTEGSAKKDARKSERRFSLMGFRFLDGGKERARYALHLLFVPTRYDWQCLPLPWFLSFLHFLFRPFRLTYTLLRETIKAGDRRM